MARVNVVGADLKDGKIDQLRVSMHNLPPRTIDRDTAIAWMKDGHSMITAGRGNALQLVEVNGGEDVLWFIRTDNEPDSADSVGDLPGVSGS